MQKYIGVDLHSDNFTACYLKQGQTREFKKFNCNEDGYIAFSRTLHKDDIIAVEATTNSKFFRNYYQDQVKNIVIVAPSEFAIVGLSTKKTDQNDSYALAYFLSFNMLPRARLKSDLSEDILSLVMLREKFTKQKTALINKSYSVLLAGGFKIGRAKLVKYNFEQHVFQLDLKDSARVELELIYEALLDIRIKLEKLNKLIDIKASQMFGYENILSIKGIGNLSAAIILATIDNIDDFPNANHLCSYFGVIPKLRQSNNTNPSCRITKRGSKLARKTLIQCTWVSIKYNPYLRNYYERLKKKKGAKRAIVATSRKMLIIIFNTLKNEWVFSDFPNYIKQ